MIAKKSKLYSVLHETCPRCHEGKVFKNTNPYGNLNFTETNERCSVCRQLIEPEPGFFQGAMYVSYALSLAVALPISVIMMLLDINLWVTIIAVSIVLVALLPPMFRYSRMIWLNMFIPYKPLSKGM